MQYGIFLKFYNARPSGKLVPQNRKTTLKNSALHNLTFEKKESENDCRIFPTFRRSH